MSEAVTIIRQAGEGERRAWAGGGLFTFKATSDETAGAMLLMEHRSERGKVTPLHLHPNEDEGFYVIAGEILVHVDGEESTVGVGGVFVVPRGTPHAFMVTSETAHLLAWQTPASGQEFYFGASDPVDGDAGPDVEPDWDRLRAVAQQSDAIELLGPPPFDTAAHEALETA